MGITKLTNQNLPDSSIPSAKMSDVNTTKIGTSLLDADVSPSANITTSKMDLSAVPSSQFLNGAGGGGIPDIEGLSEATFNIGVLGFKMAVNEGLTVFNLVDGVVDEFNDESGVDTAENTNSFYDSSSDFYANQVNQPVEMFLGTNSVTFSDPAAAPLVTVTAQEGRALPAPQTTYSAPQVSPYYPGPAFDAFFAANDPTAAGAGYMNYGRLNNLASVTWPSDTRVIVLFIACAVKERYIPPSPPYSEVEPGLPCSAVDAGIKGCAVAGKVGTNDVYAGPSAG